MLKSILRQTICVNLTAMIHNEIRNSTSIREIALLGTGLPFYAVLGFVADVFLVLTFPLWFWAILIKRRNVKRKASETCPATS